MPSAKILPPQSGVVTRVYPRTITHLLYWAPFDVNLIADDPDSNQNTTGVSHGSANGDSVWFRAAFDGNPTPLLGEQKIVVRVFSSFATGSIAVSIYEGATLKQQLPTQAVPAGTSVKVFTWDASLISDPSQVHVQLHLIDNVAGAYYTIYGLAWDRRTASGGGGGPGPELPTPLRTVDVSNMSQLTAALASALPGDHIVLADGTYDPGSRLQLTVSGTPANPIVIRAQNVLGAKLPRGFEFAAGTAHVWLWGLDFKDAYTSFLRGNNNVVRRCRIWPRPNFTGDVTGIDVSTGADCRIDYSTIRLYTLSEIANLWPRQDWTDGRLYTGIRAHPSDAAGNRFDRLIVERCHLSGGIDRQNAYSRPYTSLFSNHGGFAEDVQQNKRHEWVMRLCRVDSESGTNIVNHNNSGNVFDRVHIVGNGKGIAKFRYSGWCTMTRCRLESAEFEVMGGYHVIENSVATRWSIFAGTCAWNDVSDGDKYPAAKSVRLSRCAGTVRVGAKYSASHTFLADGTLIEAHRSGTIELVPGYHTNTQQTGTTSVPDLQPITVDPSTVGVSAPWVGVN